MKLSWRSSPNTPSIFGLFLYQLMSVPSTIGQVPMSELTCAIVRVIGYTNRVPSVAATPALVQSRYRFERELLLLNRTESSMNDRPGRRVMVIETLLRKK